MRQTKRQIYGSFAHKYDFATWMNEVYDQFDKIDSS